MIKDIRLHGFVPAKMERYEYFVTAIGSGLNLHFFYEQGEGCDRFFMGGNGIALYQDHIEHQGNGGVFSNYMINMEQPIKDMLKPEVCNRLGMYGAHYAQDGERIIFTNETNGKENLSRLFEEGHALANYHFFIAGDIQGDLKTVQEMILRLTGKFLKRATLELGDDGSLLAERLYQEIGITRWTLFVIKLIDRYAYDYHTKFAHLYNNGLWMLAGEREQLAALALQYEFEPELRDRLELDVIYKHPQNHQLIEDYKRALIMHYQGKQDETITRVQRSRLRALGTRYHIPNTLFDKLERTLQSHQRKAVLPACLAAAQQCFKELFAQATLNEKILLCLLRARFEALSQHYNGFEDLIMEATRQAETQQTQRGDHSLVELLHTVKGHLERFETAYTVVNSVAFIDDYELTPEPFYALARAKDIIDNVVEGLFEELIFQILERHQYLNLYGRKRLQCLREGLSSVVQGKSKCESVIADVASINKQLRLRRMVESLLRERVGDIHKAPLSRAEQEFLHLEISRKLMQDGWINEVLAWELFASAFFALRAELLYLKELLPQIIAQRDWHLREDFLANSELDRFRIEELEQQFIRKYALSADVGEWFLPAVGRQKS